ncbi:MAG: serine/threonine protein kinase [candidate division WS6 bacterium OLB20]|uniref:Serine/threonine protein kinase n=1 Tax=candidate division WS6 bacterium OLB20 TaxID=1617426 RepID=A0A136LZC9_9BACT|nr:MAG: serine/threonine protein kinase [candidate division WS6 bacterium OLB20]
MNIPDRLIAAYGLESGGTVTALESFANRVYLYTLNNGEAYIIKQYKVLDAQGVRTLHANQKRLRARGILIPEVLAGKDGDTVSELDGEVFDISRYVPHRNLNYQDYNISEEELTEVGRLLKTIHDTDPATMDLEAVSFSDNGSGAESLISDYRQWRMKSKVTGVDTKLAVIDEFLTRTESWRDSLSERFSAYTFTNTEPVVSHGDVSLVNLLPTGQGMYLIDWDKLKLRPPMYEVQRTIGLICGTGNVNGNLEEISKERLKPFVEGYFGNKGPSEGQVRQLIEVAEYTSHLDWLRFTLGQLLAGDFRVLELLSDDTEQNFYWLRPDAFSRYREMLAG